MMIMRRMNHHGAIRHSFVRLLDSSSLSSHVSTVGPRNNVRHLFSSSSTLLCTVNNNNNNRNNSNHVISTTRTTTTTPTPLLGMGRQRLMSTTSPASQALVDILAREEQEELETGNTELPEELATLQASLEKENWKIVTSQGSDADDAMVHMFSKHTSSSNNNNKVQVSFHCQDTVQEVDGDVDDDDDDEMMSPVRFTVTVTKAGKTLTFACLSEYGQVKIEGVSTTSTMNPESIHSSQGILDKSLYQGPEFIELAEDLQDSMSIYLEEDCHVTSDVATFVAMYADYKEQLSYVQFLKTVQSIVG